MLCTLHEKGIYHFMRDSEDQLLYRKLKTTCEMAMVARMVKIYRPDELPNEEESATPNYGDQEIT